MGQCACVLARYSDTWWTVYSVKNPRKKKKQREESFVLISQDRPSLWANCWEEAKTRCCITITQSHHLPCLMLVKFFMWWKHLALSHSYCRTAIRVPRDFKSPVNEGRRESFGMLAFQFKDHERLLPLIPVPLSSNGFYRTGLGKKKKKEGKRTMRICQLPFVKCSKEESEGIKGWLRYWLQLGDPMT